MNLFQLLRHDLCSNSVPEAGLHHHRYYVILSVWLHFAESMSGVAPPQRQGSAGLCFPATVGAVLAPASCLVSLWLLRLPPQQFFLPLLKDVQIRLISDSKLPSGVDASVQACLSLDIGPGMIS